MNKINLLRICLVCCCLYTSAVLAQTITDVHNVTINPYAQEQDQWCWAACTRMVDYSYSTTTPPSQCTIVNKANAQCNAGACCSSLNGSRTTACSNPASSNYPNNMGSCNGSLSWLINYYAAANTYASGSKTYSTVSSNLTNKKMMVARWGWTAGGGHFVVIYGCYQFNGTGQVSYANPGSGSKVTESISYFTSNTTRTWTHTITMNSGTVRRLRNPESAQADVSGMIRTYPNPSNGLVYIERTGLQEAPVKVRITNAIGQVIHESDLLNDQESVKLDLKSAYGSGLYFITSEYQGESVTEKLIVQ